MKILYDSQIFEAQKIGGISRYFYKLTKFNENLYSYKICGRYNDNIYSNEISQARPFPIKKNFRGKQKIINLTNKLDNLNTIKAEKYDVFHPTYYNPITYPKNKPLVVTAHDFIHEIFPNFFSKDDQTTNQKKEIFNKANKIIAISNNTKIDLLKFFPEIDESKIEIIYHSIEWDICNEKKQSLIDSNYILFTGSRFLYKNFNLFLVAISSLLKKYNLKLICTGNQFSKDELALIKILGLENKVNALFANEEQLKTLYENALCFVFPSLYEGFGFPILEAFASKCPIAISNTSCFPEIAGDAAIYFDPYSLEDMKEKIESLILSNTKQNELIEKGIKQFSKFNKDSLVKQTFSLYKSICYNT